MCKKSIEIFLFLKLRTLIYFDRNYSKIIPNKTIEIDSIGKLIKVQQKNQNSFKSKIHYYLFNKKQNLNAYVQQWTNKGCLYMIVYLTGGRRGS